MTQIDPNETDVPSDRGRIRTWITTPASVTRGWILLCVGVAFIFVGLAIYAAVKSVSVDNRLTRERITATVTQQVLTCEDSNDRRAEAKIIAEKAVDTDEQIWNGVDAALENGLPDELREVIFTGFDDRRDQIDATYAPVDCAAIANSLSG